VQEDDRRPVTQLQVAMRVPSRDRTDPVVTGGVGGVLIVECVMRSIVAYTLVYRKLVMT
jgi:hypothetical protein